MVDEPTQCQVRAGQASRRVAEDVLSVALDRTARARLGRSAREKFQKEPLRSSRAAANCAFFQNSASLDRPFAYHVRCRTDTTPRPRPSVRPSSNLLALRDHDPLYPGARGRHLFFLEFSKSSCIGVEKCREHHRAYICTQGSRAALQLVLPAHLRAGARAAT